MLVVNRTVDRGRAAWARAGVDPSALCVSDDPTTLADAIDGASLRSRLALDAVTLEQLDVVVNVTGAIEHGARVTLAALEAGRHVVSLNAEVDATIGYLLHQVARRRVVSSTRSPTATNRGACSARTPGFGPWGSNRS